MKLQKLVIREHFRLDIRMQGIIGTQALLRKYGKNSPRSCTTITRRTPLWYAACPYTSTLSRLQFSVM